MAQHKVVLTLVVQDAMDKPIQETRVTTYMKLDDQPMIEELQTLITTTITKARSWRT